jgi:hypothetical protein
VDRHAQRDGGVQARRAHRDGDAGAPAAGAGAPRGAGDSTQLFMVSDFLQVSHKWVAASVPISGAVLCVHLAHGAALLGNGRAA